MTPPNRPGQEIIEKYLQDPTFFQRNIESLPFKDMKGMKDTIDPEKVKQAIDFFKTFDIKTIVYGSPFAARYIAPLQEFLARIGAPAFVQGAAAQLGAPLSAVSAGEMAGAVGIAAVAGVGIGIGLNYGLPKAGGYLGEKAFDLFGPPAADSLLWYLDTPALSAFDSNKEVGDTIAQGIEAACGKPSSTTMDVLDHMGFGGWNVFKNSWGF